MALSLATFYVQLANLVPDIGVSELSEQARYQHIKAAVRDYSRHRPDTATADVTGAATRYYAITTANFPAWSEEFSQITAIEYPAYAISSNEYPTYLEQSDYRQDYYNASNQRYLFLPNHQPAATETMRITYTAPYSWTASATTTSVNQAGHGFSEDDYIYQDSDSVWRLAPDGDLLATHQVADVASASAFTAAILQVAIPELDFFAVCNKAACLVCFAIAARYSRTNDSTINADAVNHQSRSDRFSQRAKEFCAMYKAHLGIGGGAGQAQGGDIKPASQWVNFDSRPASNRRWLFHGDDW